MPGKTSFRRFADATFPDKLLALEACVFLTAARLSTLRSAKHFSSRMGELEGSPVRASPEQQTRAARIGYVVAQTARWMPFRCVCLQQVLAVRSMLKRRHIPATVFFGVLPDGFASIDTADGHPHDTSSGSIAHAWIKSGDRIVNGETHDLGTYVVVGMFS